jgi:hypothetical protein
VPDFYQFLVIVADHYANGLLTYCYRIAAIEAGYQMISKAPGKTNRLHHQIILFYQGGAGCRQLLVYRLPPPFIVFFAS